MASRDDRIDVRRPDDTVVSVSRAAYQGIYQYRGWVLAEETIDPAQLNRDQLNEYAAKKGVDEPTSFKNKDELLAAIKKAGK